jgi:hypothetical protein
MATQQQIEANQNNSQLSTGPVSEIGKLTSSKNSTVHGFTGQSVVVSPAEYEAYTAHVNAYIAQHKPATHQQEHLVQQLADLDWSLHQINVQQFNTISLMNAVHTKDDLEDPIATAKIIGGLARTLNNLNLYEVRRRRAARTIKEELEAVQQAHKEQLAKDLPQAAELYELVQESGQVFNPQEFGFVCSSAQIQHFLSTKALVVKAQDIANTAKQK